MARKGMIRPFAERCLKKESLSYGLSSYGYDMRVDKDFKIFVPFNESVIDPKKFSQQTLIDYRGDICVIPPHSYVLARSVEYFKIPRDVLAICLGKSTYARCGIVVNVTPLEPEWEGYVTIEISNTCPLPVRIYAREGIGQIIFIEASETCERSYADKKGKYQAQQGIMTSTVT